MKTRLKQSTFGFFTMSMKRLKCQAFASLSSLVIPTVLISATLLSLFFWADDSAAVPQIQLTLRVLPEVQSNLSLQVAKNLLERQPLTLQHETNLSETPIWFQINVPPHTVVPKLIELPSRHLLQLSCWDGQSQTLIGQLIEGEALGGLIPVKAGYALTAQRPEQAFVCTARFQGPAKLTAFLWSDQALNQSSDEFQRKTGLLDGGMMVMALFALIAALFNRQSVYVIFATWVFLSLRISATACGWDTQWFHFEIPQAWLPWVRSVTRAMWAILTVTLFKSLFRRELREIYSAGLLNITEWLCLVLLAASFIQSRASFLVSMWWIGGFALLCLLVCLVEIVYRFRTRVSLLYAASLTVTLLSSLSEIWSVSIGINPLIDFLNTVTASASACLLAALAIADQLRQEHLQKIDAQVQLRHTYEAIPIGLFTLDLNGSFLKVNPIMLSMLGIAKFTPNKFSWDTHFKNESWSVIQQLLTTENECELEVDGSPNSYIGESKRYLLKATLANGKIEGSLQDITEKSNFLDELKFLANHDSVTNTLNRHGLEIAFNEAISQKRQGQSFALGYLDLDRLKLINELYGPIYGDAVLKQACESIKSSLSSGMRLSRIGGDAFVILMPDMKIKHAVLFCEEMLDNIQNSPCLINGKSFQLRAFLGLMEVSEDAQLIDTMTKASHACREAKFGSMKAVVSYSLDDVKHQDYGVNFNALDRIASTNFLDGLFFEMQPILSLQNPHESLNLEVLLRMRDATGRLIPINRVIAAGEQSGRIALIDCWVLSNALTWIENHLEKLGRMQFVCVNLSGSSLNDEDLVQKLIDILQMHRSVTKFICIEITESVALRDLEKTRNFVTRVRAMDVRVALDDFGAGYTSFSYLQALSADILKIDGSFVVSMSQHAANVAIVEAIVTLAKSLGMTTIAEWAEDVNTVQALAKLGVDHVQGYVVASPMSPDLILSSVSSADFITNQTLLNQLTQIAQVSMGSHEDLDALPPSPMHHKAR